MSLINKLLSTAVVAAAVVAPLQGHAQSTYVNAPVSLPAATSSHANTRCGIFETCATTRKGLGRGDFIVRLSALGVLPEDKYSHISAIGGSVHATNQAAPELPFQYFFTDHIAIDLIAASTRHELAATGTSLGRVDVGSAWVLPPTLTLSWHFRPHKRFNPYVGVGGTLAFFHNVSPAGGAVKKLSLDTTVGPAVTVGFDYQLVGNWFFNFDAKQIFLNTTALLNDRPTNGVEAPSGPFIKAHDSLDPTLVSAGIEYRF